MPRPLTASGTLNRGSLRHARRKDQAAPDGVMGHSPSCPSYSRDVSNRRPAPPIRLPSR